MGNFPGNGFGCANPAGTGLSGDCTEYAVLIAVDFGEVLIWMLHWGFVGCRVKADKG